VNEEPYRAAERCLWNVVGVMPSERRVRLPRIDVEVRVQEVGEGSPVLFVHGGPNTGTKWAPLVAHLFGFRCLLVDRPGTGLSDPLPRRLDVADVLAFADTFVADVLDAVAVDRAHVVASSLGGFIALRSAASDPDRFDRMVQLSCPAMAPGMRVPPFLRLATLPAVGRVVRRLPPSRRANRAAMRQMGHGTTIDAAAMPPGYEDWYHAMQRHTDTVRHDGNLIAEAATWRGFDQRLTLDDAILGAVRAPTLFVWGDEDGFGGPEIGRTIVDQMPNAELDVVPGAGHLPWLDRPDAVAARVTAWLDERPAATSTPEHAHTTRSARRGAGATAIALVGLVGLGACADDRADADLMATSSTVAITAHPEPTTTTQATTTSTSPSHPATTAAPTTESPPTTAPSAIEIVAVDFGYQRVPTRLPAGSYDVTFTNHGSELHELLIFRNPDRLSLEQIHDLGPQGAVERIEVVGLVFADPGQSAPAPLVATLTPGEYEVVCFVPTPTDGRPHFAHGMHTTITVT
jgi:pimeloyl-ACP methyl ester carboxylesterase